MSARPAGRESRGALGDSQGEPDHPPPALRRIRFGRRPLPPDHSRCATSAAGDVWGHRVRNCTDHATGPARRDSLAEPAQASANGSRWRGDPDGRTAAGNLPRRAAGVRDRQPLVLVAQRLRILARSRRAGATSKSARLHLDHRIAGTCSAGVGCYRADARVPRRRSRRRRPQLGRRCPCRKAINSAVKQPCRLPHNALHGLSGGPKQRFHCPPEGIARERATGQTFVQ